MTDYRFPEESFTAPPHVIPGHPYAWVYVSGVPASGELAIGATLDINEHDAAGVNRGFDLVGLITGDLIQLTYGQGDGYAWAVDGTVSFAAGVFTIPGSGAGPKPLPSFGEQMTVQFVRGNAADEPADEPDDVVIVDPPTSSNTKAEIVAWLLSAGVEFTEDALGQMTKVELLGLVDDLTDNQVDP